MPVRYDNLIRKRSILKGLALVLAAIFGFSLLLAGVWEILLLLERRDFDADIRHLMTGMSENAVIRYLGEPNGKFLSENDLSSYQRKANEWYSDFERPRLVWEIALAFTADEREAYVYFDKQGRLIAVAVARKDKPGRFESVTLKSGYKG